MWDDKPFREELEKLGESEVRAILARGDQWANLNNRRRVAQDWLLSLEVARESKSSARKESRDDEALLIARDSAASARSQARWAVWAAIIAAVAAIVAAKDAIILAIFG